MKLVVGTTFSHLKYGSYEVVEDGGCKNVTIVFHKTNTVVNDLQRGNVKRGNVKDPYYPSVNGKGWIGKGEYVAKIRGKVTKQYHVWSGMMNRCYSETSKTDHWKCYREGVEVSKEFLDFQEFGKWFDDNYIEGWDLDKDVLSFIKGVNVYSHETCIFLPPRLNKLLIGNPKLLNEDLPAGVTSVNTGGYQARLSVGTHREYLGYSLCPNKVHSLYKEAKHNFIIETLRTYRDVLPEVTFKYIVDYVNLKY